MIKIFTLMSLVLVLSCTSNQKTITENYNRSVLSSCPDDGECTFEVIKGKGIAFKISSIGKMYPEIVDSEKLVLKFDYKRSEIPDVQDSSYNELILLEIDPHTTEIALKDSELAKVKLTFARFCFCKGQTGYYKINKGNLSINEITDNKYELKLEFKTDEVPQILTSIYEVFEI